MDFNKAKETYRKNAFTQKQMAKNLIDLLKKNYDSKYEKVFEIGAGTGFLTDEIVANMQYKKLYLNDITENFTDHIPNKYIQGEIQKIDIPGQIDLIISNAVFQWIDDLDLLFKKLHGALDSSGILAFSSFGPKNFKQIKSLTGFGLEYKDFHKILINNGFEVLQYHQELQTLYFDDVKKVLEHIKKTGVGTFQGSLWTRHKYEMFKEKYVQIYKDANGFELTYHPVYFVVSPSR